MEKFVEQSLLYDFYGELLTEHQREIYEAVVFDDLSLSEAARDEGISRQGIHDMVRRCNRALEEYESKLHLVEKFQNIKKEAFALNDFIEAEDSIDPKAKAVLKSGLERILEDI